jgi:hypothetical protein
MRPGVIASIVGHIGLVLILMKGCTVDASLPSASGVVVPIEIVDVALESNVRALAEDIPEDEVAAEETPPTEAEPAPAPTPAPTPRERRRDDDFNLDAIAGLIDKERDPGRRRTEGERADRTQQGAGRGTAEVAAMEDRVRALTARAMLRCWRMPADLPDPERLRVTLQFELDRNGNLRGQPRLISPRGGATFDAPMRAAIAAAERAVRGCDFTFFPEDPVIGQHYDAWDDLEYEFGISQ